AKHGKILGEYEGLAAVDGAPAGHNAIARYLRLLHAEFDRTVLDEHVEFLERALVEQKLDTLPRGQFTARVLRLATLLASAAFCPRAQLRTCVQNVFHLLPPSTFGP